MRVAFSKQNVAKNPTASGCKWGNQRVVMETTTAAQKLQGRKLCLQFLQLQDGSFIVMAVMKIVPQSFLA